MADIADEEQAAAGQGEAAAVGRGVGAIRVERASHHRPALFERIAKVSPHQAEPVGISRDLVRRVDGGDRILQVANGGERGFEDDVGNTRWIGRADRMVRIEHDFDVQAIVAEELALPARADELRRVGEADVVARQVGPAAARQRDGIVQEGLGPGDDLRAALWVIALPRRRAGNRVGAVERVVQAAPARIGGVEQEAGVEDRHDQLRPGQPRDFVIDMGAADDEGRGLGDQIADVAEKLLIGGGVMGLAPALFMPAVDLRLQRIALAQQGDILRREARQDRGCARPEGVGGDSGARQGARVDEIGERRRDLQAGLVDHAVGHSASPNITPSVQRQRG